MNRIVPARVGLNCVNKIVPGEQNRSKYEQNSPREQDSPREQNSPCTVAECDIRSTPMQAIA